MIALPPRPARLPAADGATTLERRPAAGAFGAQSATWQSPLTTQILIALAVIALVVAFYPGLSLLVTTWSEAEEYSYGWFIPPIVLFLIWQRSDRLRQMELKGSRRGLVLLAVAALLCIVGRIALVRALLQYGFIVGIFGVALCAAGSAGLRLLAGPLAALLLMVPLPHFILNDLSERLQLLSSSLGVGLIRACQISVYLEGNVIDLGSYKLQVVDACSGLRYLFPLMAMGFLVAYFFKAPLWKRALLLISTVPLTIAINSLRIGFVGVTVEYYGGAAAEGFLHQFEGWFMFMICLGLLFIEMAILARMSRPPQRLSQAFAIDFPARRPIGAPVAVRPLGTALKLAASACIALAAITLAMPTKKEIEPARRSFAQYPMELPGGWHGRSERLTEDVIATLQLDDYLLADYTDSTGDAVNYYVAYYANQTGAEKASHSPRLCIPGGGWAITDSSIVQVALPSGGTLAANRVVIERSGVRQLVYYWFRQQDRVVTGDWIVKWYIVEDSILTGRTDGALVRLVTPWPAGTPAASADRRLAAFIGTVNPLLPTYVP